MSLPISAVVGGPVFNGGRLLSGKQPRFPRKARLRGTGGWVTVRYTIEAQARGDAAGTQIFLGEFE